MTRVISTAAALVIWAALAGPAAAQNTNTSERTFLTFSSDVQMPGVTLPAGTYVFKLADTGSRNVVQVWNEDEDEILGQWLFVQAERPEVTQEPVVMFKETPAGTTPAVQYWYFPGERIGKEFVYPKEQAMRIAQATGAEVLTEGEDGQVASVDPEGNIEPVDRHATTAQAEAGAADPDAAETQRAEADPTLSDAPAAAQPDAPDDSLAGNRDAAAAEADRQAEAGLQAQAEPADADAAQPARPIGTSGAQDEAQVARAGELPATASPLALTGLIGLLSLAGAWGLRAFRR